VALSRLEGVCAWLAARVDNTATRTHAVRLERAASFHVLITLDGRQIVAARDLETGVIISVRGPSLRGDFRVQMMSLKIVESTPDHFLP